MILRLILIALILDFSGNLNAQNLPAYQLYDSAGHASDFGQLLERTRAADVVLFGELHNNALAHWLQFELLKAWSDDRDSLALGMEMFERDDQQLIDEYWAGTIEQRHFEDEAKLWDNYPTDYRPIVELARERGVRLVATNVPRRYASLVARESVLALDSLSVEAKRYFTPLPFSASTEVPNYDFLVAMGGHGEMSGENFMYAQALKDATMAYFIREELEAGRKLLHLNGDFHSKDGGGIVWYLRQADPDINIVVISVEETDDLNWSDDYTGRGNFLITIPASMTKTY